MFDLITRKKGNQYDVFDMMDDFFKRSAFTPGTYAPGIKTDVRETENEYILEAEIPGFDKKDINLELKNNYLTISAEKEESNNKETDSYIRRERKYGSVSRSFYVEGISQDEIKAKYNNGILEVTLPKKQKEIEKSTKLAIE